MSLLELFSWIVVAFAGAISHEIAHHLVWSATGRQPELDLWKLEVRPTAGQSGVTPGDRISAAAPYLVGAVAALLAFFLSSALWAVFALGIFQIPSRADVETMRGRVEWRSLVG